MAQQTSGQGPLASAERVQVVHPNAAASAAAALRERARQSALPDALVAVPSEAKFSDASEAKQPVEASGPKQPVILPDGAMGTPRTAADHAGALAGCMTVVSASASQIAAASPQVAANDSARSLPPRPWLQHQPAHPRPNHRARSFLYARRGSLLQIGLLQNVRDSQLQATLAIQ